MKVEELIKIINSHHQFDNRIDEDSTVILYDNITNGNIESSSDDELFIYTDPESDEVESLSVRINGTEIILNDLSDNKYIINALNLLTDTYNYIDDYTINHINNKMMISAVIDPILSKYGFVKCYDSMIEVIYNSISEDFVSDTSNSHFIQYIYKYESPDILSIRTDLITRKVYWNDGIELNPNTFESDLIDKVMRNDGKYKLNYEWMFTEDKPFKSDSHLYIYELIQSIDYLRRNWKVIDEPELDKIPKSYSHLVEEYNKLVSNK